jgi:RNA recognition motif-containing protein
MRPCLFVYNLSFATTEQDVVSLFKQAGDVVSCRLVCDRFTNKSRGFGFVEMGSQAEAAKAIAAVHGTKLGGRILKVSVAHVRRRSWFHPHSDWPVADRRSMTDSL